MKYILFSFLATVTNSVITTKETQVPLYGQCGGVNWTGSKICESGTSCEFINDYYSQCLPSKETQSSTQPQTTTANEEISLHGQCDSIAWERQKTCAQGLICEYVNDVYSHCVPCTYFYFFKSIFC